MLVVASGLRIVGCRSVVGEDGKTRTYGNLYTQEGELMPFSSDKVLADNLVDDAEYTLDVKWGTGKNGKWFNCRIV